jgi:hypothetical protein
MKDTNPSDATTHQVMLKMYQNDGGSASRTAGSRQPAGLGSSASLIDILVIPPFLNFLCNPGCSQCFPTQVLSG